VAVSRRETGAPPPTLRSRAARLAGPLENSPKFYSAFWDFGLGAFFNLTFGTDSSLTTSAGWDNVTGMGNPTASPSSAPLPNIHSSQVVPSTRC
jgi:hypothetical protein